MDAEEEALQSGLREYGWFDGQNLLIERRFHGGRADAAVELTAELLNQHYVELLVTAGSLATGAAKATTSTVPIVMLGVTDPVGQGLVASLARPDGNITGNTYQAPQLASKQLQLLTEVAPTISRIVSCGIRRTRACAPVLLTTTRRRGPRCRAPGRAGRCARGN